MHAVDTYQLTKVRAELAGRRADLIGPLRAATVAAACCRLGTRISRVVRRGSRR
jgi:hypothetical protein